MEHNMMTVKDVADYMRLSEQTIQRYVMKREIPFHKVKKVIRFRFSEIERWINEGGGASPDSGADEREGDLAGLWPDAGAETAGNEAGAGVEAGGNEGTQA